MIILLVLAAFFSGIVNALAGGGAFLTFPSLMAAGISAIDANASSTVALVPGQFVTAWASRETNRNAAEKGDGGLFNLSVISLLGGIAGSVLLLVTPSDAFRALVPWLLMFATLVFALGPVLRRKDEKRWLGPNSIKIGLAVIAVYGGYFGGGIGILILAALSMYGMSNIREMNGIKILFTTLINAAATVTFIVAGRVHWYETTAMMFSAMAGGYVGAKVGMSFPRKYVRAAIIVVGAILTVRFFVTPA